MVPVLVHARKRTFSITKTTISNTICWLFINDEYEQVTFVIGDEHWDYFYLFRALTYTLTMRNGGRGKKRVLHSSTGFWRIETWTEMVSDIGPDHGAMVPVKWQWTGPWIHGTMDRGTGQWASGGTFPPDQTIVWLQSQLPSISTSLHWPALHGSTALPSDTEYSTGCHTGTP